MLRAEFTEFHQGAAHMLVDALLVGLLSSPALALSILPRVPRRTLLTALPFSLPLADRRKPARAEPPRRSRRLSASLVTHASSEVVVGEARIPVALWFPATTGDDVPVGEVCSAYEYNIDVGKVARKLRTGFLAPFLPRSSTLLPMGSPVAPTGRRGKAGDCVVFAHGFLGSRFDLAHVCEALAADGIVCVAPELPESLAASYEAEDGVGREEIVAAARELVGGALGGATRWGIVGHSAGAYTAMAQRGSFALGRAALCPGFRGYDGADPLFVVASEGDGCNTFMASKGYSLGEAIDALPFTRFGSLAEAYAEAPPRLGAFIFPLAAAGEPRAPNHISFLWCTANDALVEVLEPFLPLAKLLRLFVLDFDVYVAERDAQRTADRLLPALRRFFTAFGSAEAV